MYCVIPVNLNRGINEFSHNHQSSKTKRSNTNKHVQVENSAGVLRPPYSQSYLPQQSVRRVLLCSKSENPNTMVGSTSSPQWIITVFSYSLKGQEKRFVSPPLYTVSHSESQWCLGEDDRAVCSFPPKLPVPLHFLPHPVIQSVIFLIKTALRQ